MESFSSFYLELHGQEKIKRAFEYASQMHKGQKRQSGEDYIIHPIEVARILFEMNADSDTICAALLHDTIEDTSATKEEIAHLFNENVANLVDGVTKISKLKFTNKAECNLVNTRKIIMSVTQDVRIIFIKLADRLHNMRTLGFKSVLKQKEIAIETLEIFVPLAYYIGAYKIKNELEDLSVRYLNNNIYNELKDKINTISLINEPILKDMKTHLNCSLLKENINNQISIRIKNIYGLYKNIEAGNKISEIHDLLALKIIVDETLDCYKSLGVVHNSYRPVNSKFKDYICNPKTNLYQSLHTTVFGPSDTLVQIQMRTKDMDLYANNGIGAVWSLNKENATLIMTNKHFPFQKSLIAIDKTYKNSFDFVERIKNELFANKIYVYVTNGEIVELPYGSTVIDLAYAISSKLGNTLVGSKVNDEYKGVTYKLNNKDRVTLLTDEMSYGPHEEWLNDAITTRAKTKILEFRRRI